MAQFLTYYPKKFSILKGLYEFIHYDELEFDHLSLMVKTKKDEIIHALMNEGFKTVKLENKKPMQIGNGFTKKLMKPWEMHVRLFEMKNGLIAIKAEVEISRKYIQHVKSVRTPVIYEIESILKKHKIEYKIWNSKVRDYITNIIDNHKIELSSPKLPAIPWQMMITTSSLIAVVNCLKWLGIL